MLTLYLNRDVDEPTRRESIYRGDFHLISGNPGALELVDWARTLIGDAFDGVDPERAQFELQLDDFVGRVSGLKTAFTNHERTKELVAAFIVGLGHDPEDTFFDLPRLRVIPSADYLTTGVSYNYKAHRDTWYAQPHAVVNFWTPVYDVVGENVMSMYPWYFDNPIANSSEVFDYDTWVAEARPAAASQVKKDERPHPLPSEPVNDASEIRVAGRAGDVLVFSTCHLHASAPNSSGVTRFSFDLRTISISDHEAGKGPRNIDNAATGSTLGDFLKVADLAHAAV
jgi:hypothetical protein